LPAPPSAGAPPAPLKDMVDPAIDSSLFSPPTVIAAMVDSAHVLTGCSWLAAGVATTLLLRTALVPLSVRGLVLQHQLRILTPEAMLRLRKIGDALVARDREALRFWYSSVKVLDFDHARVLTPLNHLVHPLLLIGVSISNILATRYLCSTMPTMRHASCFWVHDFTARTIDVDPTLTLPLLCATLQFAQIGYLAWPLVFPPALPPNAVPPSPIVNRALGGLLGVGFCFNLLFTTLSPFFPQGVLLMHWLPSTTFALVYTVSLRSAMRTSAFKEWLNSRAAVVYAGAAAFYWRRNPLRPLDFEGLRRRPSLTGAPPAKK
jgi:membrane protein insertase Oxa1/YidC/SpoIIIJ